MIHTYAGIKNVYIVKFFWTLFFFFLKYFLKLVGAFLHNQITVHLLKIQTEVLPTMHTCQVNKYRTCINYSYVNKDLEILTFVCKMQIYIRKKPALV